MIDHSGVGAPILIAIFVLAAIVILVAGSRLSRIADRLADRTGVGEIVAGALFVGASTSLPGAITSMVTAYEGFPGLAIGNALGGLTAQTAFLAIADLFYRRASLQHAGASVTALYQGVLLVVVLTIPLIAASQPDIEFWGVHPASLITPAVYLFGLKLLAQVQADPMWKAVRTDETREEVSDLPDDAHKTSDGNLWLRFLVLAAFTALAGYTIGESSVAIVEVFGLSETVVGTVFAAIANSLPELVTAVAAVRIGAVGLAIGDVIGGNAFEVLFLSAGDFFYSGSIYAAFTDEDRTTALVALLMTGILLLGLIRREKRGPVAGMSIESGLVLALYCGSVAFVMV